MSYGTREHETNSNTYTLQLISNDSWSLQGTLVLHQTDQTSDANQDASFQRLVDALSGLTGPHGWSVGGTKRITDLQPVTPS